MSGSGAAPPARPFQVSDVQAQRKFRHAYHFGVQGNYNLLNAERFKAALSAHVNAPTTIVVNGSFGRGAGTGGFSALFYLDPTTGLVVVAEVRGAFVTGYTLSPQQLWSVQTIGKLGAGP